MHCVIGTYELEINYLILLLSYMTYRAPEGASDEKRQKYKHKLGKGKELINLFLLPLRPNLYPKSCAGSISEKARGALKGIEKDV